MSKKNNTAQNASDASNATATTQTNGNSKDEFKEVFVSEDGFTPIEEMNQFPKFHDFNTTPEMVGKYLGNYVWNPDNKPESEIDVKDSGAWSAHKFQDGQGVIFLVNKNHQINQAISSYGKLTYKIIFTGYKQLDAKRKVKEFKIFTK